MVNETLTAFIKRRARELGFVKVGIAPAEELLAEGVKLQEWLGRGYQGTMEWLARNPGRRIDPRLVIPGAESVACFAMNYYHPVGHSADPATGKISRYAWGDDYHEVVSRKLEQLLCEIRTISPEVNAVCYVDTGPVMEKAWAQRAGVGWLGKHANIITGEAGSWVFLGEIILDAVLEYDVPATDQCGSCTLCIEACPTDAIAEPYVIDARRCISYLTIEHRGEIEDADAALFDRWIYGCDICQDVCPWNLRDASASGHREFEPRTLNIAPVLEDIANLEESEYQKRFRHSPVKRTKLSGLHRNAQAVLKNENRRIINKERERNAKREPS